ncbi:MAG TPA: 3-oxoacyl-ACP reductase family protein [Solirubrobacteraceae bacterium]|jgi:3-oxoacyl-[acyl-carrier protein] reductase|nr:3-oxoacyl-ACP reductase family protein [Solirubrobacteraceae bacterium]
MKGALQGHVALVTGASRGIGATIALALAQAGADVAVNYREREDAAAEVVGRIERLGRRALAVRADVTAREQVHAMVEETQRVLGPIEILVNNAGLLQQKPFAEITDTDWERVLAVNLTGVFLCSQETLGAMLARGSGRIVNVASSGGQLGGPLAPHYSAAKAGVISLTRSLARLAAPDVAVNCIAPGLIETEMAGAEMASEAGRRKLEQIPLGRLGAAEEVAASVVFLAASAPYVTGQTINVNGGLYLG